MGRIRALLRASGTVLVAIVAGALFSTAAEAAPGDLDSTFSTDGTQRTDFLTGESQAAAVVRQPDGKIVAVGGCRIQDRPLQRGWLARYELLRGRQAGDRLRGHRGR